MRWKVSDRHPKRKDESSIQDEDSIKMRWIYNAINKSRHVCVCVDMIFVFYLFYKTFSNRKYTVFFRIIRIAFTNVVAFFFFQQICFKHIAVFFRFTPEWGLHRLFFWTEKNYLLVISFCFFFWTFKCKKYGFVRLPSSWKQIWNIIKVHKT